MGKRYKSCCGKDICSGCIHAVEKRDGGVGLCPFCRTPMPTDEELVEQYNKRMEIGDAEAIRNLGCCYSDWFTPKSCQGIRTLASSSRTWKHKILF